MNSDVKLAISQMSSAWQLLCRASPKYDYVDGRGIEYIFSGLPLGFFNLALLTKDNVSAEELATYAKDACSWAVEKEVPWIFMVTKESYISDHPLDEVLGSCGLSPILPMTAMIADSIGLQRLPDELDLVVPHDDSECTEILKINSAAYGMDLSAANDMMGKLDYWKSHFPVVGKVQGKGVSTASVMMVDGCRYVDLVATLPEYHRKGYAYAAMHKALENAATVHGELLATLHASDAGRPVYERMGFKPIASHTLYMENRFLGEH